MGTSVFEASDVLPGPVTPSLSAFPALPEAGGLFCKYKKRQFRSLAQSGRLAGLTTGGLAAAVSPFALTSWPGSSGVPDAGGVSGV